MTAPATEQAAVRRYGQSAYAARGRLSPAQHDAWQRERLELLANVAQRAGYEVGFEEGRRAGRREAWREAGLHRLADAIEGDLQRIRADLAEIGVGCASERTP